MKLSIIMFILTPFICAMIAKCSAETAAPSCGVNQIWKWCPKYCTFDHDCGSYMFGYIRDCLRPPPGYEDICRPRCECAPGFLRIGSNCEPYGKCCTDPNSQIVDCKYRCDVNCDGSPNCGSQPCMKYKCVCKDGFVKDSTGKCISKKDCVTSCSEPNQVFVECINSCPEYCEHISNRVTPYPPPIRPPCSPAPCVPGCDCAPGYIRDRDNSCVLKSNCPICDDPDTVYNACGSACPPTCETQSPVKCPKICVPGCHCKPGFVLYLSRCIKPESCPVPTCGPNEKWNWCPGYCTFDDECASYVDGYIRDCPPPPPDYQCVPRCQCLRGFLRIGSNCLPPENCCPNPESQIVVDCYVPCDQNCNGSPNCSKEPCRRKKCICKPGFVKDVSGKCIPQEYCPRECPKPNEVYVSCIDPCPEYCEYISKDKNLPTTKKPPCSPSVCSPGCDCAPGYIRDRDNSCVLKSSCPKCKDPNMVFSKCGSACPATCETPKPVNCPKVCVEGCQCRPGLVYFVNKCIKPEECPVPNCGLNEIWNWCPRYCSFDEDCGSYVEGIVRDCPAPPPDYQCVPRCQCLPGFLRIGAKCVLPENCCSVPASQKVVDCDAPCDLNCDGSPNCSEELCRMRKCVCKPGYYTDSGKCIPKEECPKCEDPNMVFNKCGSACPATCETQNPVTCPPICVKGCQCRPGLVLHMGGCIKPEECPIPNCGSNEKWNWCPRYCTFDEDCGSYVHGFIKDCPAPPPDYQCVPRCECLPGFLRIGADCVLPENCCSEPTFQEVVDCDAPCDKNCDGSPNCSEEPCRRRKCVCKPGYYTDDSGKCIPKDKCVPPCGPNEVQAPCKNNCPKICNYYGVGPLPPPIPRPPCPKICVPGCNCAPKYVRDRDNTCVPKNSCPRCLDPDMVYNPCGSACPPTCDAGKPLCPDVCVPGCFCKPGLVLHNGKCRKPNQCPPKCPDPNSEYLTCGSACPPTCKKRFPICIQKCVKGCFCKKGYLVNSKGKCVLPKHCS